MLSAQVERDEPLHLYGPPRLKEYVEQTRRILDMYINYEIQVHTVTEGTVLETSEYAIEAFKLDHTKPCFGYTLREKMRPGIFYPEKALSLGVPKGPQWAKLQGGTPVEGEGGRLVQPHEVLGEPRPGRGFSFVTDTLYSPKIADHVRGVDLLLCEGMFEEALLESAREKKHMTATQAAQVALEGEVEKMGLIHYSPRYNDWELKRLLKEAQEIFPKTFLARDGMAFNIPLKD
ncbi:MAG: ribonuclease Z [Spirochaetales bacterium]|nr:ribonuclease Z [Spirochaetales bacterium]